ncbi:hypothetical protein HXX76_002551 [Chlamydomonas incerta]|uniref:Uncharacterized protein n=1 Tax=Chlamydomonas incerta TaxID=51695 RepID=A0A835W7N3_CHLIN|nr:hypothetical protein HXX76_002551 [Chlamydomonas incerta]|eukprot:KAG2442465.1 hypothetical protein HXX76_002551 [Chlamydomonas incerta]
MMRPGSTRSPVARGAARQRCGALPPPALRTVRSGSSGSSGSSISRVRGVRAAAMDAMGVAIGEEALSKLQQLRAAVERLGATAAELRAGQQGLRQELVAAVAELAAQRVAAAKEARVARLQRAQALVDSRLVAGSDEPVADEAVADALEQLLSGSTHLSTSYYSCSADDVKSELERLTGLRFRVGQLPWGTQGLILEGDAGS